MGKPKRIGAQQQNAAELRLGDSESGFRSLLI